MLHFAIGALIAIGGYVAQEDASAPNGAYPNLPELADSGPRPWDRYLRRVSLARSLYLECAGNVAARVRDGGMSSADANARTAIECQQELAAYERAYRLLSATNGTVDEDEIQRALDLILVDRVEAIESFYHTMETR